MANLDKLIKQIEKKQANEQEDITTTITIGEETFELRKLKRADKREFTYAIGELGAGDNISLRKLVKASVPYIYKSIVELPQLAVKAKEAELIKTNHDIVEEAFDIYQISNIIAEIFSFNEIAPDDLDLELEEIKKQ